MTHTGRQFWGFRRTDAARYRSRFLYSMLLWLIPLVFLAGCESYSIPHPFKRAEAGPVIQVDSVLSFGNHSQIVISAVGDIMVHGPQLRAQLDESTGSYDFSNNFRWMSSYLWLSDLSIGNLETTFGGGGRPYAGYPLFNTPDVLASNLRDAGFDVLVTANNHSMDTGTDGLLRTAGVVQRAGMDPLGTRRSLSEPDWKLREIKGIRVGMTAWTYETPRYRGQRTINGLILPSSHEHYINSYNPRAPEVDQPRMLRQIQEMREANADIILFYMHWGTEYAPKPDIHQRELAAFLAENGVNIILGTHPHVVQPVEFIGETLVVWSMGNFLSNQRFESLQRRDVEDGLMVSILLHKDHDLGETSIREVHLTKTWMYRYWVHRPVSRLRYEILPARNVLAAPEYFGITDRALLERIEASVSRGEAALFPATEDESENESVSEIER